MADAKQLKLISRIIWLRRKDVVQSTADNAKTIASMFGKETEIDAMVEGYQARVDALSAVVEGKNVLLGMYNNNAMSVLGTDSQLSIIDNEMGGNNLGDTVGEDVKPAHGDDASSGRKTHPQKLVQFFTRDNDEFQ